MKKVALLLVIVGLTTTAAHARFLSAGPRTGGLIIPNKFSQPTLGFSDLGFQLGLFARVELPIVHLQPEVLLTGDGVSNLPDDTKTVILKKIDVPIMVAIPVLSSFRVQAGPTFSIMLAKLKKDCSSTELVSNATVGYQVGIGGDVGNLYVDLKYEGSFTDLGLQSTVVGISTKGRIPQAVLSVGFNIL